MKARSLIVVSAIMASILLNGILALSVLPILNQRVNADSSSGSKSPNNENIDLGSISSVPAQQVVIDLISQFPIPSDWVQQGPLGLAALSTPANVRCGFNDVAAPVFTRTMSLTKPTAQPSALIGASIQVRAYSPGWGSAVTSNLLNTAETCGLTTSDLVDVGAPEAILISDDGAREAGGPSGSTVLLRYGDVIGVISVRGGNSYRDALNWSKSWYSTWPSILESACSQGNSKPDDQKRSPLFPGYRIGWPRSVEVELSPMQRLVSDIVARIIVVPSLTDAINKGNYQTFIMNAGTGATVSPTPSATPSPLSSSTSIATPTSIPTPTPSSTIVIPTQQVKVPYLPQEALPILELAQLPRSWPQELSFQVDSKPAQPAIAPDFPVQLLTTTTAAMPQSDPIGPGCGWAYIGLSAPPFEDREAEEESVRARLQALKELMAARGNSLAVLLDYSSTYASYASSVKTWNSWVNQQIRQLSTVWWPWYEDKKQIYDQEQATYLTRISEYTIAYPNCPTDSGTIADPALGCPALPIEPKAPEIPGVPKF